jgi:hypothetical protein
MQKLREKKQRRSHWVPVDHSILVAHDFSRGFFYTGFWAKWEIWLADAGVKTSVLDSFDELWLVPVVRGDGSLIGDGAANAVRILGTEPNT